MFAPKVPIFWNNAEGELTSVRTIKVEAKQIEHKGINIFWKNIDLLINKGSDKKNTKEKIVQIITKTKYLNFNWSFNM